MRVVTVSEAPVAGLVLEERLIGLYRRKQVVDDLIRSLEQYGRVQHAAAHGGGIPRPKGRVPMSSQGAYGLLK